MCNTNIYKYIIAIISIIVGIVAGVLFYMGTLTNIAALLPIFAIIAAIILALILVLLLIPIGRKKPLSKCLCLYSGIIVFSSIFTIGAVLLTLAVTLVATSVLSAVLIGIVVGLFAATLLGLLFFIYCLINKKCGFNRNSGNNYCCYNTAQNTATDDECGFDLD